MTDIDKLVGEEAPLEVGQKINEVVERTNSNTTDLINKANDADVVHTSGDETIGGIKTLTEPLRIQNGFGTGAMIIGADVNASTLNNNARKLARVAVPTQENNNLNSILLSFDSSGDSDLNITNKSSDNIAFGGSKKITNATSPMSISFCVATERNAKEASKKRYPLEMDAYEARFNVQPNYKGIDLATIDKITTYTAGDNIKIEDNVISASGLPVGFILWGSYSDDYVPENTLETDGTEFTASSGEMFNNLWDSHIIAGKLDTCSYAEYETEVTMTGSCWKWAVDTANEKFKIPFIPDKVLVDVADTIGVRGNGFALGIENPVGEGVLVNYHATDGTKLYKNTLPFDRNATASVASGVVDADGALSLSQDALKSGAEADAATAKTYKTIRHYVVVATGSINQSEADWSEFASSLKGKANTDLSNTNPNASFRRDSVRWGIPDYEQMVEIETVSNTTTTYAAVQDGIVWGKQISGTTTKTITINGKEVHSHRTITGTMSHPFLFPLYQGDIIVVENTTFSVAANNRMYFAPFRE